jgi:hypothetical protein
MAPIEDRPCTQAAPTAVEQLHAAIAFKRTLGNLDPDVDHQSGASITAPHIGPVVISCIAKTQ